MRIFFPRKKKPDLLIWFLVSVWILGGDCRRQPRQIPQGSTRAWGRRGACRQCRDLHVQAARQEPQLYICTEDYNRLLQICGEWSTPTFLLWFIFIYSFLNTYNLFNLAQFRTYQWSLISVLIYNLNKIFYSEFKILISHFYSTQSNKYILCNI